MSDLKSMESQLSLLKKIIKKSFLDQSLSKSEKGPSKHTETSLHAKNSWIFQSLKRSIDFIFVTKTLHRDMRHCFILFATDTLRYKSVLHDTHF